MKMDLLNNSSQTESFWVNMAKNLGDTLIVGVATDRLAEEYKRKPIIPLYQRIDIIENIKCVDSVVTYDNLDVTELLIDLKIDVMVVGGDWGKYPEQEKYKKYIQQNGKKLIKVPYTQGISTTVIRKRILENDNT